MTFRKRSKNGGDGGTGVYIREGTTSRVTAADRPYGKFYDFYSVSLETFGSTHVSADSYLSNAEIGIRQWSSEDQRAERELVIGLSG